MQVGGNIVSYYVIIEAGQLHLNPGNRARGYNQ